MRYQPLAGLPLTPSRICLGGGGLGTSIPQAQAFALLDAYAACGGNWVDTAHVYASWLPDGAGASERTIGAWLRAQGAHFPFMVGTKGAHPRLETMHISRLSPVEIAQDLHESLERLQRDHVDLYWLHRDDPAVPVGEILGALNEAIAAGLIRAIGASNWTTARLQEAADYACAHGLRGFVASQIGWSLAEAHQEAAGFSGMLYMDTPTLGWHRAGKFPAVAYSSQAGGFFGGKYSRASAQDPRMASSGVGKLYFSNANFARLERAQALAAQRGCSANQIALAYLLNQPFPAFAIAGCRTPEQARASCAAADLTLTPEEIAALEA